MNAQTVELLQEIVRRESLSLLSYMGAVFPWTKESGAPLLSRLKQLVAEHNDTIAGIGRYLTSVRHPLRYLGSYPSSFTTLNFLSLDYLLKKLVEAQRAGITRLEGDLATLADKDAHTRLDHLLKLKKQQLETLELLSAEAGPTPAAAS